MKAQKLYLLTTFSVRLLRSLSDAISILDCASSANASRCNGDPMATLHRVKIDPPKRWFFVCGRRLSESRGKSPVCFVPGVKPILSRALVTVTTLAGPCCRLSVAGID